MQDGLTSWVFTRTSGLASSMNRGTICVEVHPLRIQPGINCGLIPEEEETPPNRNDIITSKR